MDICLSPPVKYFLLTVLSRHFFIGSFMLFLHCVCYASCVSVYWCLVVTTGKGLTSWLSLVMSSCEFATFSLVSWVGCGTWLYRLLIFALFLTLSNSITYDITLHNNGKMGNWLMLSLCLNDYTPPPHTHNGVFCWFIYLFIFFFGGGGIFALTVRPDVLLISWRVIAGIWSNFAIIFIYTRQILLIK